MTTVMHRTAWSLALGLSVLAAVWLVLRAHTVATPALPTDPSGPLDGHRQSLRATADASENPRLHLQNAATDSDDFADAFCHGHLRLGSSGSPIADIAYWLADDQHQNDPPAPEAVRRSSAEGAWFALSAEVRRGGRWLVVEPHPACTLVQELGVSLDPGNSCGPQQGVPHGFPSA
jgi:hypothetical protein